MTLTNGVTVAIQCLGEQGNARWLDGNPNNGAVNLQEVQYSQSPGRNWRVSEGQQPNTFTFECLGVSGDKHFLDGNPSNGAVVLQEAPTAGGTDWQVTSTSPGVFNLTCMGSTGSNRLLNGNPNNGQINLSPSETAGGTYWNVFVLLEAMP